MWEYAWESKSDAHEPLLRLFLELDREPAGETTQEAALRGVRKAQIKLATYYLTRGEERLARRIHEDMAGEPRFRLQAIRQEMEAVSDPEFWEVSDRGINFEYLPPERRAMLDTFYGWFTEGTAPAGPLGNLG